MNEPDQRTSATLLWRPVEISSRGWRHSSVTLKTATETERVRRKPR